MNWVLLSVEAIEKVHADLIDQYGGSHGLRDAGLLASAVQRGWSAVLRRRRERTKRNDVRPGSDDRFGPFVIWARHCRVRAVIFVEEGLLRPGLRCEGRG